MAMMNPPQQRLLMERLRRDPRMAALIAARQQGGGGLAELAGLPQGAANLAEIAGLAPEPQVVTPAQPAPVEPGVELQIPQKLAPDDTQLDLRTAQERAREQTQRAAGMTPESQAAYSSMVEGKTPAQIVEDVRQRLQQEKKKTPAEEAFEVARRVLEGADAERKLSPEEQAVYNKRAARYEEQLANLGVEDKRAGWKALALGSMKMAQSREPYFASALAAGLEAGLTGFDAAKMERAERKARLQAAQEQTTLDQEMVKRANYDRALARQTSLYGIAKNELAMRDASVATQIGEETYPYVVEEAKLKPVETKARIGDIQATTRFRDRSRGTGTGPGDGDPPAGFSKGVASVIASLQRAIIADNDIIADGLSSRAAKKAAAARARVNQETLDQLLRRKPGAAAPAGTTGGGGAAEFRYDQKTGKLIPNR